MSAPTTPSSATDRVVRQPWTCPFCALLCDSVGVATGEQLSLTGAECPRARAALERFEHFVQHAVVAATAPGGTASTDRPYWLADDFLRALALLLMAWAWSRIAAAESGGKPSAGAAFWRWVWPEFEMRLSMMDATLVS